MLTGRRISADRALAIGLVNAVSDGWFEAALELAEEVATAAPVAVQLIKEALWSGLDASFQSGLSNEFLAAALAFGSDDRVEGMRAFAEKRAPVWSGIRDASSDGVPT
jgi:enoyl-CoA hydratase